MWLKSFLYSVAFFQASSFWIFNNAHPSHDVSFRYQPFSKSNSNVPQKLLKERHLSKNVYITQAMLLVDRKPYLASTNGVHYSSGSMATATDTLKHQDLKNPKMDSSYKIFKRYCGFFSHFHCLTCSSSNRRKVRQPFISFSPHDKYKSESYRNIASSMMFKKHKKNYTIHHVALGVNKIQQNSPETRDDNEYKAEKNRDRFMSKISKEIINTISTTHFDSETPGSKDLGNMFRTVLKTIARFYNQPLGKLGTLKPLTTLNPFKGIDNPASSTKINMTKSPTKGNYKEKPSIKRTAKITPLGQRLQKISGRPKGNGESRCRTEPKMLHIRPKLYNQLVKPELISAKDPLSLIVVEEVKCDPPLYLFGGALG